MRPHTDKLLGVSKEEAVKALKTILEGDDKKYCNQNNLDYYAFPKMYSNTAGPFAKPGMLAGQAFCKFTIEMWHLEQTGYAVLFCEGKILKVTDDFKGSDTEI